MTIGDGAELGSGALLAAQTASVDVITGYTGTIANNIGFVLLVAVVLATLWGIKFLFKRMFNIHRG